MDFGIHKGPGTSAMQTIRDNYSCLASQKLYVHFLMWGLGTPNSALFMSQLHLVQIFKCFHIYVVAIFFFFFENWLLTISDSSTDCSCSSLSLLRLRFPRFEVS